MLKGISPLLSPDLLFTLASMGHGDEIALVDANFPAASHARQLIRLPSCTSAELANEVLRLFPLDEAVPCAAWVMTPIDPLPAPPPATLDLQRVLKRHGCSEAEGLARNEFYARARAGFAIVQTGETRPYGNLLLKKGVVSPVAG
ncbi:RbsD/FucU domain-containing protein [Paraburkholderia phymatum]|uniref:RbsD/FucU family protein n=1 Tax=Paraburkholderia phymatum TaxID=148447 RepID=UPI00318284A3